MTTPLPPVPDDAPSDAPAPAIEIRDLHKRYGRFTAVDGVSFSVAPGDFFAFLGPNGAGKTTTINAIVGLAEIDAGSIRVNGHDVTRDYRAARSQIGLAPQEYNFDRYLTIEEVLTFHAGYFGIPMNEAKPRARQLLTQFELWDKRDKDFTKLSGGMKRRLSLARALIHSPKILILDEPTAGVDLELRLELWEFLRRLNRSGMTIFLTTHYLEEAEQLCNRVGIINKGHLVALDTTQALKDELSHEVLELRLETPVGELPQALADYEVERGLDGRLLIVKGAPPREFPRILRSLEARGHFLADIQIKRQSLQDIFLHLTSKQP